MEKSILIIICFALTLLNSCNQHQNDNLRSRITDAFWKEKGNTAKRDSVLSISMYKKTNKYTFYTANIFKRPLIVDTFTAQCLEMIDSKSIFNNKCESELNDSKKLSSIGIVMIASGITPIYDGLKGGYIFIFRNGASDSMEFRKIDMDIFYSVLESNSPQEPTLVNEDIYFDSTAVMFWKKGN